MKRSGYVSTNTGYFAKGGTLTNRTYIFIRRDNLFSVWVRSCEGRWYDYGIIAETEVSVKVKTFYLPKTRKLFGTHDYTDKNSSIFLTNEDYPINPVTVLSYITKTWSSRGVSNAYRRFFESSQEYLVHSKRWRRSSRVFIGVMQLNTIITRQNGWNIVCLTCLFWDYWRQDAVTWSTKTLDNMLLKPYF